MLSLALPLVVFLAGAAIMAKMTNRQHVIDRLPQAPNPEDRKPLSQRYRYDLAAVTGYFGALDNEALLAEQHFLEVDLVFPFLYGAALAVGLLLVWNALGRPFAPACLLWAQSLSRFWRIGRRISCSCANWLITCASGSTALNAGWIQLASAATLTKLVFFTGSSILLICLVLVLVWRALRPA